MIALPELPNCQTYHFEQHTYTDSLLKDSQIVQVYLTNGMARMEMKTRTWIFNFEDTLIYELLPKNKTFKIHPFEDLNIKNTLPEAELKKTGEIKKINGFEAEKVLLMFNDDQAGHITAEIWISDKTGIPPKLFTQFAQFDPVFSNTYKPLLLLENGFPVYQVIQFNDQQIITSFRNIRIIDRKNGLFSPPPSWKKIEH